MQRADNIHVRFGGKRLVGDVQAHDLNHTDEVLYAFINAADGLFAGE